MTYNGNMQIGDEIVYTLSEAAAVLGLDRRTLYLQVKRGKLRATMSGREYRVLGSEVERYREEVQGKHGFAAPTHPLHGKRGGAGGVRRMILVMDNLHTHNERNERNELSPSIS